MYNTERNTRNALGCPNDRVLLYQPAVYQINKRTKGLITFQAMDEKLFKVKRRPDYIQTQVMEQQQQ